MSVDIFNMSDEELLKLDPSTLVDEAPAEEAGNEQAPETQDQDGEGQGSEAGAGDEGAEAPDAAAAGQGAKEGEEAEEADEAQAQTQDQAGEEGQENQEAGHNAEGEGADTAAAPGQDPAQGAQESKEAAQVKTEKPVTAEASVDAEAEYQKLLKPFMANGKEMSVKNVDEAITLMQMGANYNKKMAALAPNLKLLKLLESSGLMSEEKISYLIDLANKDAGAINKLVKDSGIDPMDLSTEKADEYKPTVRTVNDKEIELDSVLEEIQSTPSYQRTLGVVGKEWDAASRQTVAEAPQLLKIINSHVQTGIYDLIVAEVERERVFGRLRGLSDIEAYRQVGDAIQARGGFDHLGSSAGNQGQQTPAAKTVVVQPKPKQAVDEAKLKEKRLAAAMAKPAGNTSGVPKDFNPLAMSDEEFSKLVKPNFL